MISPTNPGACIVKQCPAMFELRTKDGVPACVYKPSPDVFFTLRQANMVPYVLAPMGRTIVPSMNTLEPALKAQFEEVNADYQTKSTSAVASIEKTKLLQDMFKELQAKENVRDQAPEAYQKARTDYYTLLKGDAWLDEEKKRIADSEAGPKANQYKTTNDLITERINQQQQTYDIIKGVKDKMLSMKDDFQYTTRTFNKQIEELKSQINIERQKYTEEKQISFSWLNTLLNVLIVIVAIYAIIVVARKIYNRQQSAYTSYSNYY
jgi:nitrogen fixation/metabolism regulation signal transduction histidine kinase